jgi:2-methylcitrate dehydratase PrpD
MIGSPDRLAGFAAALRLDDLPQPVRDAARGSLLDGIGDALAAAHAPALDTLLAALAPFAGPARVSIPGRSERLDALHATLAIGYAARLGGRDDARRDGRDPAPAVLPVVLALAEWAPRGAVGGAALLAAYATGLEVGCRAGAGPLPGSRARDARCAGLGAAFGAAAAAGRLLGLDAAGMGRAFAIAAAQPCHPGRWRGDPASVHELASAAPHGLLAALLAAQSFPGAQRAAPVPRGGIPEPAGAPGEDPPCAGPGARWLSLAAPVRTGTEAGFESRAAPVLGAERARWLAELCQYLERVPDARVLAELAAGGA